MLKIVAADKLTESTPIKGQLSSVPPIDAPEGARVREFKMTMESMINDKKMDMYRIDEVVPAGTKEIWVINNFGWSHNFHIHNAAFRVLDINDKEPREYERGRKDTVFIPNGSTVRLAVEFGDYPDPNTPLMYHCHLLKHEDDGMMGRFLLVEPGTESQIPAELPKGKSDYQEHDQH